MKRLLIRADDLGYSRGVNYGIVDSVRGGLVGSVGVMTNMESVDHGLELLDGLDVCLGQHTNICVGRPLTDPALIPSLCGPDGMFKPSGAYRDAMKRGIDFVVLDEVVLEIEAQYRKFVSLVDREPSYFEGHAVASPAFYKGLEIVAERHGLPLFPMGAPGEAVTFKSTRVAVYMPTDFRAYEMDPFSAVRGAVENANDDACTLMVFHPGYIDAYLMGHSSMMTARAREASMLCDPATREWLVRQDIALVTYDDLS